MAYFPQAPGAKIQLKINGTWTDATRYDAQTRVLLEQGISITRGRQNTQDRTPPSSATFQWLDPNGVYNNENPRSPYYGLLPLNTPVRVVAQRATPALLLVDITGFGVSASTTDKAALDITGDIDIRIDVEPRLWTRFGASSGLNSNQMLCAKTNFVTGGISWYFRLLDDGRIQLLWSTTGNSATNTAISTVPVPTGQPRMALRVQLQVNNGAGGNTCTFATASTIDGSYTTLGSAVVGAGTTSLFNSPAKLEVGAFWNSAPSFRVNSLGQNFFGRIYAMQLRNGIGGTLVANADFTAQANGTTSFVDSVANTWGLAAGAEITDADYRFHGELSEPVLEPMMSANGVGKDVRMTVTAGGIMRRLSQNATPLRSPIYQQFNNFAPDGWWTGEDNSTAQLASSGISGGNPASITDITFGGYDATLPGSAGTMVLGGTGPYFSGVAVPASSVNSQYHFIGFFRFPTIPLSQQTMFTFYGTGTIKRWVIAVAATSYILNGYDSTGALIVNNNTLFGAGADPTTWIAFHIQLTQNGSNVDVKMEWQSLSGINNWWTAVVPSYAGTVGAFTRVVMQGVAALSGVKVAHIMVTPYPFIFLGGNFFQYTTGFAGETADARFARVCNANGVSFTYIGRPADTLPMGAQPIDTLMNILYECAEVEAGFLTEARDRLALEFRSRNSATNQMNPLILSYTVGKHLMDNLRSTSDDSGVANDITMSRRNGGSARATLTYGPKSIQAPPSGIGTVPDSPTVNNYLDADLPYLASYRLGVATWPEARYPQVGIAMHRTEIQSDNTIFLAAVRSEIGSKIIIKDLPLFMPAEPINLIEQGCTETLKNLTWDIDFNCTPYGPWNIGQMNGAITGLGFRASQGYDANGVNQTQLGTAINTTATSLSINTLSGPLLTTDSTQLPADIFIGGERMTVTAITGSTSPQTVTVTRSVNGIVKSQVVNAPVTVAQAFNTSLS